MLQTINDSAIAMFIRQGFAFPTLESIHVIGLAIVFGTIAIVDLRLLGFAAHHRSALRLIQEMLPFTWIAFGVCVVTGLLMFVSHAPDYVQNRIFVAKMGMLLLAGLNMAVFHRGAYRRINEWDTALPPPGAARAAGLGSLALWTTVIFLGRWVGF